MIGAAGAAAVALTIFLVLVASTAIVLLIVWQVRVAKRRKEALMAWCQARGFTFTQRDTRMERDFRGFTPFGAGSGRVCKSILAGQHNGHPVRMFGYQYTVQSGKNSQTYHFRILAVQMAEDGRGLDIKKEHLGHKLVDALGGEDIDFESDEFSRAFWVKCTDRRFAYDLLHPRMQEWLLQNGRRHWQWHHGMLLLHEPGAMDVRYVDGLLEPAFTFIDLLPRHRRPAEASL